MARFVSHRIDVVNASTEAVSRALEECGLVAERYAKQNCPTKTGRLKNSISHDQVDATTEAIGTNVEYAPYVELGHHQQPGRYVPAIKKRLKKDFVEGKHFLKKAASEHADQYKQIIKRVLSGN